MSNALTVNLKHLYQCRTLWFFYVVLGVVIYSVIFDAVQKPTAKVFSGAGMAFSGVIGLILAELRKSVLSRPFVYLLPHNQRITNRWLFILGVVINLIYGSVYLLQPEVTGYRAGLIFLSGWACHLIFFWLGCTIALAYKNSSVVIGFVPLIVIGLGYLNVHLYIEHAIINYPINTISAGIIATIAFFVWLNRLQPGRKFCGVTVLGIADCFNTKQLQNYEKAKRFTRLKDVHGTRTSQFFLERMAACEPLSLTRYLWGSMYNCFGPALLGSYKVPLTFFMIILTVLYIPGVHFMIAWCIIFPLITSMRKPIDHDLLLPAGRTEKFGAMVTIMISATVWVCITVILISILSFLLKPILPDIQIRTATFSYTVLDIGFIYIPLVILPLIFTISLYFRQHIFVFVIVAFIIIMPGLIFYQEHKTVEAVYALAAGIVSWSISLVAIRYYCYRRSLCYKT